MNGQGGVLSVPRVQAFIAAGLAALERQRQRINDLNVYPVPDGDTGTNLVLSVRAILDYLSTQPPDLPQSEVLKVVSQAALMGARGNSGVILSQIVRGVAEVLETAPGLDSGHLARALAQGTETAYHAIRKPVEGTMLTVLRHMSEVAQQAEPGLPVAALLERVVAAGWAGVEETPSQLKVLADAGVVDAGGYGLVVLVEGMAGCRPADTDLEAARLQLGPEVSTVAVSADLQPSASGYCTSFLLTGQDLDRESVEQRLLRLGDCVLVVGDSTRLKIHVHTDHPGRALELGSAMGVLSHIEIDNMAEQAEERNSRLEAGKDNEGPADIHGGNGSSPHGGTVTQLVAVVAGEGNKQLFRNLGVDLIVDGGQSMNPSTEEIVWAVERSAASGVIILPNNGNVVMAAEQTAKMMEREVHVVPTSSIQAGLSAAVVFDPRKPAEANLEAMRRASQEVATAEVTHAVRDSMVDGVEVSAGHFIGLVGGRVIVSSANLDVVLEGLVALLLSEERELLTALIGEGEHGPAVIAVLERVWAEHPEVELEIHEGGQPFYPVLLSAE